MKKAQLQIVKVPLSEGKTVHMSIAEKQSDLGLFFNERLLILIEGSSFGYLKSFKLTDQPEKIDVSKCKSLVPIKNVVGQIQINNNTIGINFLADENGKKVSKKWVFKMASNNLANQWAELFKAEKNKIQTKRSHSSKKRDGQPSPKRSQVQKNPIQGTRVISPEGQNFIKRQPIKDFNKNSNNNINKVYENNLYETQKQNKPQQVKNNKPQNNFILPEQQPINNENINRKLQYTRPKEDQQHKNNPNINITESKVNEKIMQQQIQKQRQLERKQRQLKEKEEIMRLKQRRLQEEREQLKKEQQKSKIANRNQQLKIPSKKQNQQPRQTNDNQITVIDQKFFHKDRQTHRQPQIHQNQSKIKTKAEGVNYSDIVNKVILSKNNELVGQNVPKNKKVQETHEYLFQLQKLKMSNQNKQQSKEQQIQPLISSRELSWTYRYLVKQNSGEQYQIIHQFKQHCSNVLKQVVNELHLPERKRSYLPKYRGQQFFIYEKNDVEFKIAFIGLKQVYNQDDPDNSDQICDQSSVKKIENQFKNYRALYRAIRQVKSKSLRVPLYCLCQYQGFVSIFKAQSQFQSQPISKYDKKTQLDIESVSNRLNIHNSTLTNKQNTLILKLNNNHYREIASQNGFKSLNFDYYFIDEIKCLMPADIVFSRNYEQNNQRDQTNEIHYLRQELVEKFSINFQEQGKVRDNILSTIKKKSQKSKQQRLSQYVLNPVAQFIKQLDNLQFYFLHPKQLQERMHLMGINMRYLGLIYGQLKLRFQKCLIMSQISARSCKILFRKTLQDLVLQQQTSQPQSSSQMLPKIADFLNCILGSTVETVMIWKVLSAHAKQYFNVQLVNSDVQKGYFICSLLYHCGIQVSWDQINVPDAFVKEQFFSNTAINGAYVKVKAYDPAMSQEEKLIIEKMRQQEPGIYQILQDEYQVNDKMLPLRFRSEKYLDCFRRYLVNFIAPDSSNQRGSKLLYLYNNFIDFPTKTQVYLKFMQLKWYLKRQKKQKYVNCFASIISEITKYFGDFHPILSQLYDVMSIYHKNNGEFEDAITFSKSSVINMLKVCGSNHPKVGESYFQLALCCIKGNKKEQAILNLQKSKSIFEANQQQANISYAHVCSKLGLLFLSQSKTSEAQKIVKYAKQLFEDHYNSNVQEGIDEQYEQERVQCYEILSRCYQLEQAAQMQIDLSLQCQKQIIYIKSPNNLQRMLKIILSPILGSLRPHDASVYLDLISLLPLQISVNTYMKGFQKIYERIHEQSFIQNFEKYLENIGAIEKFVKQNNSLHNWKGLAESYQRETVNDFLSLTQQLIYFLGEGFVTGSIRDSL